MKRFEIAIEISKQLITLCSGLILGVSALAANILVNESSKVIFTMMVFVYVLLMLSIVFGILHIGAVANLIETAEKCEFEKNNSLGDAESKFTSMFDNPLAPIFCGLQQWLFFGGVLILVIMVVVDWNM